MIAIIGLVLVILFSVMLAYRNANNEHKEKHGSELTVNDWLKSTINEDLKGLIYLLIGTAVILAVLGTLSFRVYLSDNNLEGWSMENFTNWINNTETVVLPEGFDNMSAEEVLQNYPELTKRYTYVKVAAGLAFGIVFGFIDNAGLFFGMDALDTYIQQYFGEDKKVAAGIGNTFSDVVGAFAGAFAGSYMESNMKKAFPKDIDECVSTPLWADAVGIFIGCIIGIIIPKAIMS